MASKDTQKTVLLVGVVGICGYAAYKLVPKLVAKMGGGSSNSGYSGSGGGSGYDADGYPYTSMDTTGQQSGLSSLLQSLSTMFHGSGSSGGGGSKNGQQSQGYSSPSSSGSGVNPIQTLADFVGIGNQQLAANESGDSSQSSTLQSEISNGYFAPDNSPLETLDVSQFAQPVDIPQASGMIGTDAVDSVGGGDGPAIADAFINDSTGFAGGDSFGDTGGGDYGGDY